MRSSARRSAPTVGISSPRRRTRRRGSGMPRPASRCGCSPDTRGGSMQRRSAPTVGISSRPLGTRRRGSGMPRPARRCGRSPDTRMWSSARRSAPMVGASSRPRKTGRHGSGIPRPARRCGSLTGHQDRSFSAVFSADGRRIVTASWDKTARIWDTESGQELRCARLDTRIGHQRGVQRRRSAYLDGFE